MHKLSEEQLLVYVRAGILRIVSAARKRYLRRRGTHVWWSRKLGQWVWVRLDNGEDIPLLPRESLDTYLFSEDPFTCPECGRRPHEASADHMVCQHHQCLNQWLVEEEEEDLTEE